MRTLVNGPKKIQPPRKENQEGPAMRRFLVIQARTFAANFLPTLDSVTYFSAPTRPRAPAGPSGSVSGSTQRALFVYLLGKGGTKSSRKKTLVKNVREFRFWGASQKRSPASGPTQKHYWWSGNGPANIPREVVRLRNYVGNPMSNVAVKCSPPVTQHCHGYLHQHLNQHLNQRRQPAP